MLRRFAALLTTGIVVFRFLARNQCAMCANSKAKGIAAFDVCYQSTTSALIPLYAPGESRLQAQLQEAAVVVLLQNTYDLKKTLFSGFLYDFVVFFSNCSRVKCTCCCSALHNDMRAALIGVLNDEWDRRIYRLSNVQRFAVGVAALCQRGFPFNKTFSASSNMFWSCVNATWRNSSPA
uniref:Uncharacterized protein n=1 Tax=Salmonella sp. TaxID=599 RepID=A0A482ET79_SALSP|nr:hypothetical protein [Salmonella sp.]QBM91398.1 hypothetical protein NNIBIDOC_00068 [Salmonella sp.]